MRKENEYNKLFFSNYNIRENYGVQVTCRLGNKWLYRDWETVASDLDGEKYDSIQIEKIWYIPFKYITDEMICLEHDPKCRTKDGLRNELIRVYGKKFCEDSGISIVFFYITKPKP